MEDPVCRPLKPLSALDQRPVPTRLPDTRHDINTQTHRLASLIPKSVSDAALRKQRKWLGGVEPSSITAISRSISLSLIALSSQLASPVKNQRYNRAGQPEMKRKKWAFHSWVLSKQASAALLPQPHPPFSLFPKNQSKKENLHPAAQIFSFTDTTLILLSTSSSCARVPTCPVGSIFSLSSSRSRLRYWNQKMQPATNEITAMEP